MPVKGFEAVDLPFGLSVAPREFDCIFYGISIPAQNAGETHDCRELGVDDIVDPFIQCLRAKPRCKHLFCRSGK